MYNVSINDLFDEKNEVESATGLLYGCYFILYIMPASPELAVIFTWEIIIKSIGGIILAFITAAGLTFAKRWTNDFYDKKISPKWGDKTKKNVDTTKKEDDEERA